MDVYLTFDVEVWCDGWVDLDRKFPAAFERYVYGRSRRGDFALPKTLETLNAFGLKATFFVEALFACRFGVEPLAVIVELIRSAGQDVQLHLHPEWADETHPPLVDGPGGKRPLLSAYSLDDQTALIAKGKDMFAAAGAPAPRAFRAGSYGCNRDTLTALARNGLQADSSVNPSRSWSGTGLGRGERGQRVTAVEGVVEYPVTVYSHWPGRLRQAQVGSTSFAEFAHLLPQARRQGRSAFVIVSHNFEMLVPDGAEPDPIVVRRFTRLCRLLAEHRSEFQAVAFAESPARPESAEPETLTSPAPRAAWRTLEQLWRRTYR